MNFAEKLEFLINFRNISQSALSRKTGIAQSAISDMTRAIRRPYLDQAFLLARALEVTLDYLADDDLSEPVPAPAQMNDRERAVLEMVRGLGTDRAILRLLEDEDAVPRGVSPPSAQQPRLGDSGAS